jgi:hypothetical protein
VAGWIKQNISPQRYRSRGECFNSDKISVGPSLLAKDGNHYVKVRFDKVSVRFFVKGGKWNHHLTRKSLRHGKHNDEIMAVLKKHRPEILKRALKRPMNAMKLPEYGAVEYRIFKHTPTGFKILGNGMKMPDQMANPKTKIAIFCAVGYSHNLIVDVKGEVYRVGEIFTSDGPTASWVHNVARVYMRDCRVLGDDNEFARQKIGRFVQALLEGKK